MRDVVWSQAALDDTEQLVDYIAADNLAAAEKVLNCIELTAQRLGQMAVGRRGRVEGTYEKPVIGLRYIIAYAISPWPDGTEKIVILRVIHTARQWPKGQWPK